MQASDPSQPVDFTAGTRYTVEINPRLPRRIERLAEFADDLYYSWDRFSRGLFFYLDAELWDRCRHNPRVFLRRVAQQRLDEAAADRTFMEAYNRALANYDTYLSERARDGLAARCDPKTELVAYFCLEFGFHESLPIYSGGLGILAGDFCKAASDIGLPFVAVGLLYRQGNMSQSIDEHGHQVMTFTRFDIDDMPVVAACTQDGCELIVRLEMADEPLAVRVWRVKAGHIDLYLLDSDLAENSPANRAVTNVLYTADRPTRLKQEIVLGIGGVRALRLLGLAPTVWHMNEGHPSLQVVERCRERVARGLPFAAALEQIAASTVFTSHTPVPAGHETFDAELMRQELGPFIRELGIREEEFLALGGNSHPGTFNLTTFALRASRFHNGVSRIHGGVAARMESHLWPEVPVSDNPMGYVTNGVHVPSFLAREWIKVIDDASWRNQLLNAQYWQRSIDALADATFWSVHLKLKQAAMAMVRLHVERRCRRFGYSQAQIDLETRWLCCERDVMLIGFARRFATYKRATLLLDDLDRLRRLLDDGERPVCIVFAGRAHPSDEPGQELIRRIHQVSRLPEFLGRVILIEGYDLALGRALVSGSDLWVNVPEYPLEASGTSGMKAGINGVVNLSVMDGWWAEGWNGRNGYAVQPHDSEQDPVRRRWLEAREVLDILEHQAIPTYFDKHQGLPPRWVAMAKESMKSIIPRFSAQRMLMDYIGQYYLPAIAIGRSLAAEDGAAARMLADWRREIHSRWPAVRIRRVDEVPARLPAGAQLRVRVAAWLDGLRAEDIAIECLIGRPTDSDEFEEIARERLHPVGSSDGETVFELELTPALSGLIAYKLRAFPQHPLLCHPFEAGLMKWL